MLDISVLTTFFGWCSVINIGLLGFTTIVLLEMKNTGGVIGKPIFPFPGGCCFHFTEPSGDELAVWAEPADEPWGKSCTRFITTRVMPIYRPRNSSNQEKSGGADAQN